MTNERSYRRSGLHVLEVRGRHGTLVPALAFVGAVDGGRYIVSLWGESQWARNLRATGSAQLRVGGRIEPIEGHELQNEEEKAGVLLAIFRKYPSVFRRYSRSTRSR
jgi:F420H(2)-dependent quinone reductase